MNLASMLMENKYWGVPNLHCLRETFLHYISTVALVVVFPKDFSLYVLAQKECALLFSATSSISE